ncbi:hypothetical protein TrST_g5990 [Triparma strigata]|uniref:Uncharacterized protein n=1 Tax=Triparma strigata TaxID=1606541 RepID=A0A9W7BFJ3_9STRA|nr:hypothetical protein TrST_g5990 [Triparma strigata]
MSVLELIAKPLLNLSSSSVTASNSSPCSLAKRLEICALEARASREQQNNCVPSDYAILEALAGGLILVGVEPSSSGAFNQLASHLEAATRASASAAVSVAVSVRKLADKNESKKHKNKAKYKADKTLHVQTRSKQVKRLSPRRVYKGGRWD